MYARGIQKITDSFGNVTYNFLCSAERHPLKPLSSNRQIDIIIFNLTI